ncbi:hypothetical protein COM40_25305 [Bacillus wiedmannii]|uniref:hypothetical protein n=1 Tax=Bacillus wiedmannii TaxID=1890302 RepID=UPI000BF84DC4|nr:hypothetical protein [Bacillus wiedmannii]PGD52847.1 hypothetical protein COM40_25305 [Bacillus wiedmannii]
MDENKLKKGREGLIGYTLVGEFFDFSTFQKFIKVNIGAIHNNITNIKCDKEDNYEIELKAINNFTDQELISSIKKRESTVLFSIYKHPSQKKDKQHINKDIKIDQVISHWVAICDYDEKSSNFIVSDSNSKKTKMYTGEQLIDRNNQLTNKKFYWDKYNPIYKRRLFNFNSTAEEIKKLVIQQLELKDSLISMKVLNNVIEHTVGQMLVIRKIR